MAEIEFTIDAATGELRMHIKGIAGPGCDDVAKLIRELAGDPGQEEVTAEYHLRPRVRSRPESHIHARHG
jgi:Protein of unknown function (DUF2997)